MAEEFCGGHQALVQMASEAVVLAGEHTRQLERLFNKMEELHTAMAENNIRAQGRDRKLTIIEGKIDNGLSSTVKETKERVEMLTACLERRRAERALADQKGFIGWLKKGLAIFKERSASIVVTSLIIGGVWYCLWILTKIQIFHEGPVRILKFFGIG